MMRRSSLRPSRLFPALLSTIVVGMVLFAAPVAADRKIVGDSNDTAGRFDVKLLSHRHARRAGVLIHRLGTYHNWRNRSLRGSRNYLDIWFTTDKEDRYAEKRIVIDFEDGELRASIQSYQEYSDGAAVGPPRLIRVRRPNRHAVSVLLSRKALVGKHGTYGWSASTSFRRAGSPGCGARACFDSAPVGAKRGLISHRV
jgi:hypothetical protein